MNVKPSHSGKETALTGERLVEQIRVWLAEISEARASVYQVDRFGLLLTLIAVLLIAALLSIATGLKLTSHSYDPRWVYSGLALSTCTLAALIIRPAYSNYISHFLALTLSLITAAATITNGMLPFALVPGMIAFIHVLVRPNIALLYNGMTLVWVIAILVGMHDEYDSQIFFRLTASSVISIAFWQLVSRFWRRLIQRVSVVTTDMSEVLQRLESERLTAQSAARHALLIEPASGLLNRDGFIAALAGIFEAETSRGGKPNGLVVAIRFPGWIDATTYLDVPVQDNLLRALVARLKQVLNDNALLARSGNEDYLAWVPGSADVPTAVLIDFLFKRARQLDLAVTSSSSSVPTRPRIGISRAPDDGCTADILLADAELALMSAVRTSKAEPVIFTPKLLVDAEERYVLMRDLENAIAAGQLELHYQPILSVPAHELHKGEALIRWRHPQRGLIPPDAFIPLAEQSDLIIELTDWVFRQVADQIRAWRRTLHPQLQVSINIAPAYLLLCAREPRRMLEKLRALNIPERALLLEITEGVMLEVTPELVEAIDMLRSLGFMIAIDDFGVGYSSFGQLCKLKLDFLKLDKTFIRNIEHLPKQQAICRAIVQMAHEMGCKVVAEGVETEGEREILEEINADYLQGFLFCRPLPVDDFQNWVAERRFA